MSPKNLRVVFAIEKPKKVEPGVFHIAETDMPRPADGEVLLKTLYLSCDPYMILQITGWGRTSAPTEVGRPMHGRAVSEVVESRNPGFKPGDTVLVPGSHWAQYTLSTGADLIKVDAKAIPASVYIGACGQPGITAWGGMADIGRPRPGETVVVSAAAGAVGSVAGQIARIKGARVVGIAGGADKCAHVVNDLGFAACVDYRAPDFADALAKQVPNGIDVYFENVGGKVLDTVLPHMNRLSRLPLCGLIAQYSTEEVCFRNFNYLMDRAIRLSGFHTSDYVPRRTEIVGELVGWVKAGELRYRESIAIGIENAPKAFMALMGGEKIGKQLIKVA